MPTTKKTQKKPGTSGPKRTSTKKSSSPKVQKKVRKVMREYKEGKLRSGSKKGPRVKSRKQAIAIALNEAGVSRKKRSSAKRS